MQRDELASWLRLTLTPGVGPATARLLLARFGLPAGLFGQSREALRQVVTAAQAEALLAEPDSLAAQLSRTWAWLHGESDTEPARDRVDAADGAPARAIVTLADADYPAALLETADPPVLLYLTGRGDPVRTLATASGRALAIVGSRNPTAQGEVHARTFARELAQAGWTIVSGLALGVDGAAHAGALEGADPQRVATVAVVGTGLDRVYPARHRALAHRIAQHGLLVSEYPLGTPPVAANFPRRNRLIAGLSQGTLVVEAALQSGSLITARLAAEQGREVLAIPGSIQAPQSRGCHALIKQGAQLVESAGDVLEALGAVRPPGAAPTSESPENIATIHAAALANRPNEPEGGLLAALGFDPVGLDALQARTGLDTARLQAALLDLELDGQVARLPGGLFQRQTRA